MRSFLFAYAFAGLVPFIAAAPTNGIGDFNSGSSHQTLHESAHDKRMLAKRASRTSAPSGCLTVGPHATHTTISSALTALGHSTDAACIFVSSGTYQEQLTISYGGHLTLYGETSDTSTYESNTVLITHTITSSAAGQLDLSSTVDVTAANFRMYNINVENGYGEGSQAVALTANADSLGFYGCQFIGYQDTLYAKAGTHYYSGCLIKGAVDYIFGDASAWFTGCTIMSTGGGSITAMRRETTSENTWYVFDSVTVTSNRTDLRGQVYLGRPWRGDARVTFQNSELSNVINAAGWTTMADNATPFYYEYNNSGAGASTSGRRYETRATSATTIQTVLGSGYTSWVDHTGTGASSASSSAEVSAKSSVASNVSDTTAVAEVASPAAAAAATCTPTAGGSANTDDTPAIHAAIQSCGNGGTIVIPARTTYHLRSVLNFTGCSGCQFQLEGTLQASNDLTYWEGLTAIMDIRDITGLTFSGSGTIDGNGQAAWDRFATDTSYRRPTLFYIDGGSHITVDGFTMINPPNVFHSVRGGATNVAYSNLVMTAQSTSQNDARNTDGFDIGAATHVTLTNARIVNDDDCIAFKPGANYVTVTDVSCTGSHGLSVGSLGKSSADTVSNIYVNNATMISSTKAVGIKTYPSGGTHAISTVHNVTFSDIVVQDCGYAIQIQSCYDEDASYCAAHPGNSVLTDVRFEHFSGSTSSSYAPATANLNCGADGTCGVTISNYDVSTTSGRAEVLCAHTPSTLGVSCTSGASG